MLLFSSISELCASQNRSDDYGQFVDIADFTSRESRFCDQAESLHFLYKEQMRLLAIKKRSASPSILVDAVMDLYFATETATQKHTTKIDTVDKKNSWQKSTDECCQQCRLQEIKMLKNCPISISSWIVIKKSDLAILKLKRDKKD